MRLMLLRPTTISVQSLLLMRTGRQLIINVYGLFNVLLYIFLQFLFAVNVVTVQSLCLFPVVGVVNNFSFLFF